jgi:hypothetical protein
VVVEVSIAYNNSHHYNVCMKKNQEATTNGPDDCRRRRLVLEMQMARVFPTTRKMALRLMLRLLSIPSYRKDVVDARVVLAAVEAEEEEEEGDEDAAAADLSLHLNHARCVL